MTVKVIESGKHHVWFWVRFTKLEQHISEIYKLLSSSPGHDVYDIYVVGKETGQDALLTPLNNTFLYTRKIHLEAENILGHGNVESKLVETKTTLQFDSPIEQRFWDAWVETIYHEYHELTPQYPIGRYKVDFANSLTKIAIELDGHATHSSPDAIAYDRKRQRYIESEGWRVIRFGGKEVYANALACVREVGEILRKSPIVNTNVQQLVKGDRVRHPLYGDGVIEIESQKGSPVWIKFDKGSCSGWFTGKIEKIESM